MFKIFYLVTKERNTDKLVANFLILIMFIQIFDLMISPIMKIPFRGAFYDEVSALFDVIRIYPAIVNSGSSHAYWFFMLKPLTFLVMFVVNLFLVDFSIRNPKF